VPEIVVDPHQLRPFGDLQKRPVDVQEESCVRGQPRHGSKRKAGVGGRPVLARLPPRGRCGDVAIPAP